MSRDLSEKVAPGAGRRDVDFGLRAEKLLANA